MTCKPDLRKCPGPTAATFNTASALSTPKRAGSTNSRVFQEPEPGYRSRQSLNTRQGRTTTGPILITPGPVPAEMEPAATGTHPSERKDKSDRTVCTPFQDPHILSLLEPSSNAFRLRPQTRTRASEEADSQLPSHTHFSPCTMVSQILTNICYDKY